MFDQSGIYKDVSWSVAYKGGRLFELRVGEKLQKYKCMYEPIFGLDISDSNAINLKLDEMQGLQWSIYWEGKLNDKYEYL